MVLYYITDRGQFPGDEGMKRQRLLEKIRQAAACGVDLIQLREKDLTARELERLALEAVSAMSEGRAAGGGRQPTTRLLINSRTDVAIACAADGVHLRSRDILPSQARDIWTTRLPAPIISVSCHSGAEVKRAASEQADFAVFGAVFEKTAQAGVSPAGLRALHDVSWYGVAVLAVGGVTLENAQLCMQAGAAGVAAIRLFQDHDVARTVASLRDLGKA